MPPWVRIKYVIRYNWSPPVCFCLAEVLGGLGLGVRVDLGIAGVLGLGTVLGGPILDPSLGVLIEVNPMATWKARATIWSGRGMRTAKSARGPGDPEGPQQRAKLLPYYRTFQNFRRFLYITGDAVLEDRECGDGGVGR